MEETWSIIIGTFNYRMLDYAQTGATSVLLDSPLYRPATLVFIYLQIITVLGKAPFWLSEPSSWDQNAISATRILIL